MRGYEILVRGLTDHGWHNVGTHRMSTDMNEPDAYEKAEDYMHYLIGKFSDERETRVKLLGDRRFTSFKPSDFKAMSVEII